MSTPTIRANPTNHAPEGDERIRTAELCLRTDLAYEDLREVDARLTEIGYRLAALADGEGCFVIARQVPKSRSTGIFNRPITPRFRCEFVVNLRADDLEFLWRMRDLTGLGSIYESTPKQTPGRRNNPKARWVVNRKEDCGALIAWFDAYPLWSKKRHEYAIWREAALRWLRPEFIHTETWQRSYDDLRKLRAYKEAA